MDKAAQQRILTTFKNAKSGISNIERTVNNLLTSVDGDVKNQIQRDVSDICMKAKNATQNYNDLEQNIREGITKGK